MPRKPSLLPTRNFGPIRIKADTYDQLHHEARLMSRSACSVARELIELWLKTRKKARKE